MGNQEIKHYINVSIAVVQYMACIDFVHCLFLLPIVPHFFIGSCRFIHYISIMCSCGVLRMLPLFKAKILLFDVQKKRLSLLLFFSLSGCSLV